MLKQGFRNTIVLGCLIFLIQGLVAQDIPQQVNMSVGMEPMLRLNIQPDVELEFGIIEINEELYHVTKEPEDVLFSVESTTSWNLAISSERPYFIGEKDPKLKIPVDCVGITVESRGTNWDNGVFSNIINFSKDTILELSNQRTRVLTNGRRNNLGGADKNTFIVHWKLLWENNSLRMKTLAQNFMVDERYKVNVQLTLTETLCRNCY